MVCCCCYGRSFQIVANVFVSHVLTIFYGRRFVWQDLKTFLREIYRPNLLVVTTRCVEYYQNQTWETLLKFALIYITLQYSPLLQVHQVHAFTVLLAIPQLYRRSEFRQLRVILGPLTPVLAVRNVLQEPSVATVTCVTICLAAFVVLRPDNTQVLDLVLPKAASPVGVTPTIRWYQWLRSPFHRRQWHGALAACNTAVAFLAIALHSTSTAATSTTTAVRAAATNRSLDENGENVCFSFPNSS